MELALICRTLTATLAAAAFAALPARADTPAPIGATLSVINVVTAEFNRDVRTLATGDDVRQNELIDVSADASTELKLNDDTKLALGPGAKLMLDKFVYDPDKATGTIGVDLVEGAFRFMTGIAKKPSYVVRTPRASITVRGTIFDVYVEPNDTTWLLLHEGAVRVCNDRGDCRDHDEAGKLIRISPDGDVGRPSRWANLDDSGTLPFDTVFPFVVKPPVIDPTPLFSRDEILREAAIEREPKKPTKRASDDADDKPSKGKKTKKAKGGDDESKPQRQKDKPGIKVTTPKPDKKKPTKVTEPNAPKPGKKKPTKTAKTNNDEAAQKALGLAIGVGIGIGLGKIGGGGGGGRKGGGDMPRGNNKY